MFPNEGWPLYRDEKGHVREVRKKDLKEMVGRWISPEMDRLLTRHERVIVRGLARDVDFLIRGGRFE